MSTPVDFLVSVYNISLKFSWCKSSLDSILNQDYNSLIETYILDDGSTDDTFSLISNLINSSIYLSKSNLRRFYLYKINHSGLTKSLNTLIKLSKNPLVFRMDYDDLALPSRVMEMDRIWRAGCWKLLCSPAIIIKENQELEKIGFYVKDFNYNTFLKSNPVCHSSVAIDRSIFSDVGIYNSNLKYSQDYDLWYRIYKKYPNSLYSFPNPLIKYRFSNSTISNNHYQEQKYYSDIVRRSIEKDRR